jgi:Tfp pilus assembly protein PilO
MRVSDRELLLATVTGAAILLGVSYLFVKPKWEQMKSLREEQAGVRKEIEQYRSAAMEREKWQKEMESVKGMLAKYPADQAMDVVWLSAMDNKARKNGVNITKRKAGEEKQVGDVYELPIECSDWEGSLSALTHFLFELQNEGAMFDVRQLKATQVRGSGELRGGFTLFCAYIKEGARKQPPRGASGRQSPRVLTP